MGAPERGAAGVRRRHTRGGGGSCSASVAIHPAGYSVGSSKGFLTWTPGSCGYPPSNRVVATLAAVPLLPSPPSIGFRACEAETMARATTTMTAAGPVLIL